jgi:hypothetical protein
MALDGGRFQPQDLGVIDAQPFSRQGRHAVMIARAEVDVICFPK